MLSLTVAARPTQCRTFPWWPQNLVSDYDWQVAAADCEGIHVTQEDKQEDIPAYSFDDVLPETILHDIHRSGEDYTYDELKQMLHDLREVDPEFVEQYKAEFVATFSREIVHSDDKVTVLDSFIEGEGKPTRSFVFNDRLHLTQSEVALSVKSGDSALSFDRSSLALDVHRALCMPLAWLQSDQQLTPLRVAVLGAGACSLPLFLLEQHSPEKLGHLDAIEPSSEVNDIARRFFGVGTALSRDARFVLHEKMGEDFLSEQSEDAAFDLLILDVEAGEGHDGVNAPPLSMLESSFLFTAKRLLAGHGILAINVITESEDALRNVETHLGQAFSRGLQLSLPSNSVYFLLNDNGAESPYDVGEYIQQLKESTFQTQYACTTQLLEKNRLTMWLRKER
ncbi:hypothetical protein PHYBOEH_003466 [Phytophthora boehmeriae]|uniref:Uncharacterized protein n=1 Tax=Phytophthora boehmeriae TaxID=109152 RepID=A0A8T1WNJ9_9STRA|nr:hypothetical protein PHYBOEH_003466 [Phytophthora boehmeriae]